MNPRSPDGAVRIVPSVTGRLPDREPAPRWFPGQSVSRWDSSALPRADGEAIGAIREAEESAIVAGAEVAAELPCTGVSGVGHGLELIVPTPGPSPTTFSVSVKVTPIVADPETVPLDGDGV